MLASLVELLTRAMDERPIRLVVGCALVLAGLAWGALHLYETWRKPEQQLVTLQQANAALAASIEEFNTHLAEDPERVDPLFDDTRGKLVVRSFRDGCVVIQRSTPHGLKAKLVVDLARDEHDTAARAILPVVFAAQACADRCPPGHPAPFTAAYGDRHGCWIDYWRTYEDGCVSVQPIDTCDGVFGVECFVTCRH